MNEQNEKGKLEQEKLAQEVELLKIQCGKVSEETRKVSEETKFLGYQQKSHWGHPSTLIPLLGLIVSILPSIIILIMYLTGSAISEEHHKQQISQVKEVEQSKAELMVEKNRQQMQNLEKLLLLQGVSECLWKVPATQFNEALKLLKTAPAEFVKIYGKDLPPGTKDAIHLWK